MKKETIVAIMSIAIMVLVFAVTSTIQVNADTNKTKAVYAKKGETIWLIAYNVEGNNDIRRVVNDIYQLNPHLNSRHLRPGDKVIVPDYTK